MATASNIPTSTTTATTTTTTARSLPAATTAATTTAKSPSRPQTPHPSSFPLYHFYSSQNIPIRTQTQAPNPTSSSQQQQQQQGILYPVASSGRGFIPRPVRPPDQTVTVANNPNLTPGAYRPRAIGVPYRPSVRSGSGSPRSHLHLDSGLAHQSHLSYNPVQLIRQHPTHLQHHQQQHYLGAAGGAGLAPIKGIPVTGQLKAAPALSPVSDSNGYKNLRDRGRDESLTLFRDRKLSKNKKLHLLCFIVSFSQLHFAVCFYRIILDILKIMVKISDEASLYALCRSWLRNGFTEESQPHYGDVVKSLPRPLPIAVVDTHSPKKEGEEEVEEDEEDEESVDHLSAQDLLKRHIKRAKKVRARLREGRLKRIARYKTRLALLLPPHVEQLRNETAAGN
ncbi:uncharacterized protein LOC105650339 isoform X1 [Jatropha curcas]|uniref:uncharacterized protein LOC105650339 isoform X1 n=1 Tax=Jatropha curcas TaxID=180498 RepID=UPI0005FB8B10|nr:uncharacterized protein LOC105650339 isoform X1 [Jatropha curcas]